MYIIQRLVIQVSELYNILSIFDILLLVPDRVILQAKHRSPMLRSNGRNKAQSKRTQHLNEQYRI